MTGSEPAGAVTLRRTAAALVAVGTACLLAALAVAGGIAAVALDALGDGSVEAGGCMGAVIGPMLVLLGAAGLGMVGAALTAGGGVLFWRITATAAADSPGVGKGPADGGE